MGTVLDRDRCRVIAEAYLEGLTAVARLVPSGPPADPERFHCSYRLAGGTEPLRLDGGWAFPVHGSLTGAVMEMAVAVSDVPMDAETQAFLVPGLTPRNAGAWREGRSFAGLFAEAFGPMAERARAIAGGS